MARVTYTVKKGDTLSRIAAKYGTTVNKLMTIKTTHNCLGLLLHSDKLLISLALSFAMSSLLRAGFALLTRRPTQNPLTTH